ncbi:uncharacterized protein [Aquarana catesbeiana]|uniref:uncharacterized protein n=1 Tax=Aquarana catesbeiana TaxID=8400 RepID=UPI003CC93913
METFILPVIIILFSHNGLLDESICGGSKFLTSTIEGRVTLSIDKTEFSFIYWFTTDGKFLAKTSPGEPAEIRQAEYEGKLKATADGSLIIMNLTREDKNQYIANVQTITSGQCLQRFHLQVFDALSVESCAVQTNISSEEGTEVTLPGNQTSFESITWVTLWDLVHFAVTKPRQPVVIQDDRYQGRLNATANGFLIITGLTREDQGTYGAYLVTPTSQQCAQLYNLRVTGFYQEKTRMDYTTENTIRLAISGCVLLITCFVLSHHMKTEVMSPSTDTHEHRRCSKVL